MYTKGFEWYILQKLYGSIFYKIYEILLVFGIKYCCYKVFGVILIFSILFSVEKEKFLFFFLENS